MNPTFDFTRYAPPRLTEATLRVQAQRRQRRCYAALLSLACSLWNAAVAALGCVLLFLHPPAGMALLILWCWSLMAAGAASLMLIKRKGFVL